MKVVFEMTELEAVRAMMAIEDKAKSCHVLARQLSASSEEDSLYWEGIAQELGGLLGKMRQQAGMGTKGDGNE